MVSKPSPSQPQVRACAGPASSPGPLEQPQQLQSNPESAVPTGPSQHAGRKQRGSSVVSQQQLRAQLRSSRRASPVPVRPSAPAAQPAAKPQPQEAVEAHQLLQLRPGSTDHHALLFGVPPKPQQHAAVPNKLASPRSSSPAPLQRHQSPRPQRLKTPAPDPEPQRAARGAPVDGLALRQNLRRSRSRPTPTRAVLPGPGQQPASSSSIGRWNPSMSMTDSMDGEDFDAPPPLFSLGPLMLDRALGVQTSASSSTSTLGLLSAGSQPESGSPDAADPPQGASDYWICIYQRQPGGRAEVYNWAAPMDDVTWAWLTSKKLQPQLLMVVEGCR